MGIFPRLFSRVSPIAAFSAALLANDDLSSNLPVRKATPTATRHIILIRHGQYEGKKPYALTELGREQAELVGRRLSTLHAHSPLTSLTKSTMTRATETGDICLRHLPCLPSSSDSLVEEGMPFPPEPPVPDYYFYDREYFTESARCEAAFRKYFHRAEARQEKDSFEVVVCHGNLIRYFICRSMPFPPEGWLRMSLPNCSLTWISMLPDGMVKVRSIGDTGHLPPPMVTFN